MTDVETPSTQVLPPLPPPLAGEGWDRKNPLGSARLSAACGARIDGIDLARPLSPASKEWIWRAFLAHRVLLFRGQALSREQQFAFAAQFGEVEPHGGDHGRTKRDGVAHVLSNLDAAGNPTLRRSPAANYHWHTDKPYRAAPPMLTMLHAVELPPSGSATEFADTALAYDALAETTKRRIAELRVAFCPAFDPDRPGVDHPLVRTHPETGAKALYLGNHATRILGLRAAESAALLHELLAHATEPRFVYAHRWRLGDLVMWDNRCLLHRAVIDAESGRYRRILYRSTVKGTAPE